MAFLVNDVDGAAHVRASDDAGFIVWKGAVGVEYLRNYGNYSEMEEIYKFVIRRSWDNVRVSINP
jgi:hypothetical protein